MMLARLYFRGRKRCKRGHYQLDEERRKLEEEETETAPGGEGYFETVDKQRMNRDIQVNLEVECPHTMSLRI